MITADEHILVRFVDCNEDESINKFSLISGRFDENGKLVGKVILKLREGEDQKYCVKVNHIFGSRIVYIESDFVGGIADQVTMLSKHSSLLPPTGKNGALDFKN